MCSTCMDSVQYESKVYSSHRVDRVLGFFSSRPLRPQASLTPPPPPTFGYEGAHYLVGEGVGGSQFGQGYRHCSTPGIYVLCESSNEQIGMN